MLNRLQDVFKSFQRHEVKYIVIVFLISMLSIGCHSSTPKVAVEPLVFNHSDEVLKGTGEAEGYWALADRRIFAVMAFLNTAGYDQVVPNRQMHPFRIKVRKMIAENLRDDPDKLAFCRQYYKDRPLGAWQYTNFALSLSSDYPFRRIRPDKELTYAWTRWRLADLPDVLNDFWITAELDKIWAECHKDYIAEAKRCDPNETARGITFLWKYLRMPRKDNYTIIRIPNLLERHATANANRFEHYFYSVEGPRSGGYIHEYLHTIINDLVEANYARQKDKLQKYFEAGKDAPISSSYQELSLWTAECLVHALDHRISVLRTPDSALKKRIETNVAELTQGGYGLLRPLYELLADFEKCDMPFDRYLPIMLEKLPKYSSLVDKQDI